MKCKDCECHDWKEDTGHSGDVDVRSRGHYCIASVEVKYPHEGHGVYWTNRYMNYREFIKCPDWCPLRLKEFETSTGIYPIVAVGLHL
jgi:hypothetical protein